MHQKCKYTHHTPPHLLPDHKSTKHHQNMYKQLPRHITSSSPKDYKRSINKLAEGIRQIYCQVNRLRRAEVAMLDQTSGLLAAQVLKMGECKKIQGYGQVLLLQQCTAVPINIYAEKTERCGYQPLFKYKDRNYTIGLDGYSMHPYSPCFWPTHFINVNGKIYSYEHGNANQTGEWKIQEPTIHAANLDLISKFEDDVVKNYNFELKRHPAYDTNKFEQLNVVADIIGRLQDNDNVTLERLTVSRVVIHTIERVQSKSWTANIISVVLSGIAIFGVSAFCYWRFVPVQMLFGALSSFCCGVCCKKPKNNDALTVQLNLQPTAPP